MLTIDLQVTSQVMFPTAHAGNYCIAEKIEVNTKVTAKKY